MTCDRCGLPAALVGEGEGTTKGFLSPPGHVHDTNRYSGEFRCPNGHHVGGGVADRKGFAKPCPTCGWILPGHDPLVIPPVSP